MSLSELRLPLPPARVEDAESAFAASFALMLASLHLEQGGDAADRDAVYAAARLACVAVQQGHACADLQALADEPIDIEALRRSPLIGDGAIPTPLVMRAERLYLYRYWRYERELATRLGDLNQMIAELDIGAARAEVDGLFAGDAVLSPNWQKVAVATALARRLCVISGGPGTGKTTTVVRMLAAALQLHPAAATPLRIAIAAPTGKAAARLSASIQSQLSRLSLRAEVIERLPTQAFTLHRLLGPRPGRVDFYHHAGNPLPFDLVVVDEASMIDLALAAKLVDALLPTARLILLGDKDQLASVEAGAVYAELSARGERDAAWCETLAALSGESVGASAAGTSPLDNAVVWLRHAYRFDADSGIAPLAASINQGDPAQVRSSLASAQSLRWEPALPSPTALAAELSRGYAAYAAAVAAGAPPAEVLATFDQYRVLCSTRSGSYGSEALSRHIAQQLRRSMPATGASSQWYAGRAVMVTDNDYGLRLFNGDIGVALPDAQGSLLVFFAADEGLRSFSPARLPQLTTAFALTVHKSQGSEFDRVDVVVEPVLTRGLTRELLYTAVTRARRSVRLWCAADLLDAAVRARVERRSSLLAERPSGQV